ncbi:hypothetical protein C1H46_013440 [Malus baccata]|uniref:Uncharacterized protein n=1 Tax=Malus baccata TaxID=106549 RepID=A0A540MRB0_MALBA|nr:hypothetical protein C1H46_013440 [Malus baccata]
MLHNLQVRGLDQYLLRIFPHWGVLNCTNKIHIRKICARLRTANGNKLSPLFIQK